MAELKKNLGLAELVFFGIGAIVGTGIFVIPSIAANIADVASFWIWLELGMLTIFMAFCFAELSSIYPHAGGPYKFVKEAFGNFAGFLAGWLGWTISWFTIASLAVAFTFYLSYFYPMPSIYMPIVSIGILGLITFINLFGLKWGVKAQYVLTSASILILWAFITWGIYYIDISNFRPTRVISLPALFFASVFVIEPFIGWETITYFAEEAKNPKIDVPKAIVYSSVFVAVLYSATIFVTLGLLKSAQLKATFYPLIEATKVFMGPIGVAVIGVGAVAVLLGCINSWVISTSRLPFALARDGFLPNLISKVSKSHIPYIALLLQLVVTSIAIAVASFEGLVYILVAQAMIMYIMIFISIPVHRRKVKDIPYKLPFKGLVPAIATLLAIFVLTQVELSSMEVVVGILTVGAVIYAIMKHTHKKQ